MNELFRGGFSAIRKLSASLLPSKGLPKDAQILECNRKIREADMMSRLIESQEYEVLKELFERHYERAIQLLRRGNERSSLDELDSIQNEINSIIRTGQQAKEKLAKLQEE